MIGWLDCAAGASGDMLLGALGSLAGVALSVGGAWGLIIRRVLEAATRTLPLMLILFQQVSLVSPIANVVAIVIAFWMRLSIETYPGIRRSYVILPSALTGHGLIILYFVLTRFPYDRVGLLAHHPVTRVHGDDFAGRPAPLHHAAGAAGTGASILISRTNAFVFGSIT